MKALISIVLLFLTYSSLAIESADPMPFAAADTELMIPVEGGKVYVRINGELDKGDIPVIFLHGGPGLRHNSLAGLVGLADERPVILYDQLDGGKSDQANDPKNWRIERFVEKTPGAELAVIPGGSHGFLSDRPLISEAVLRSCFRRNEPSQ